MAPQRKRQRPDDYFVDWKEREALAESMIPIVGTLAREKKCQVLHLREVSRQPQCPRHYESAPLGASG